MKLIRGHLIVRRSLSLLQHLKQYFPFLLVNALKGLLPVIMARLAVGTDMSMIAAGIGAVTGHSWPVFGNFKTERGVAVALGVLLGVNQQCFGFLCSGFLLACATTKNSLLGFLLAFAFLPVYAWLQTGKDVTVLFSTVLSAIVIGQLIGPLYLVWSGKARRLGRSSDGTALGPDVTAHLHGSRKIARCRFKLRLAISLVAAMLFLVWLSNTYVYRGFTPQPNIVRAGDRNAKVVAITFDDGPDPQYTPEILKVLRRYGVKATFFMIGKHVQKYPDIARMVVAEGHELGNHTYSHPNMVLLSPRQQLKEIDQAQETIAAVTGVSPRYFRPPRGLYDKSVQEYLQKSGYKLVLWSLSSEDWIEPSPIEIRRRIERLVRNGDIILFHDSGSIIQSQGSSRASTVRSLPLVIEALGRRGYTIVPLGQLLEKPQLHVSGE
ncbi:MAG: glycerol-3-phosphate acyltransferase [Bacillota bacterium]